MYQNLLKNQDRTEWDFHLSLVKSNCKQIVYKLAACYVFNVGNVGHAYAGAVKALVVDPA